MNIIKSIGNMIRGEPPKGSPSAPTANAFNARRAESGPNNRQSAAIAEPPRAPAMPAAPTVTVESHLDVRAPEPATKLQESSEDSTKERTVADLSADAILEVTRRHSVIEQRKKLQEMLDDIARDEARTRHREHMQRLTEMARLEREEATRLAEERLAKKAIAQNKPERTWEAKFSKRFYGIDPIAEDHYGFLPNPILKIVMERGNLRTSIESIQQKLEPFFIRFELAEKHIRDLNLVVPQQMLRDAMAKDASLAADGKFAELVSGCTHPDPEEIRRMLDFRRILLREAQKLAAESCSVLIFEIGEKLQAAARLLAEELDETERRTAEQFGVEYVPSEQLKACVKSGLYYAEHVRGTFLPAARTNPRHYIQANLLGN